MSTVFGSTGFGGGVPYELIERKEKDSDKWYRWTQEDEEKKNIEEEERKEEKGETEEDDKEDDSVMTEDELKDVVGAKYLKMCNNVCFLNINIFSRGAIKGAWKRGSKGSKEERNRKLRDVQSF